MDYDKVNNEIDVKIEGIEKKVINIFYQNLNFIRNLRKYITNEKEQFEKIVLVKAMKLTVLMILVEGVFMFFGKESILGIYPKVITLCVIFMYHLKVNQRGGK